MTAKRPTDPQMAPAELPLGPRVARVIKKAYAARLAVLLEGPTGIGKSELLLEVAAELGDEALLDWRSALRSFVARERSRIFTYTWPSRRFPGQPGRVPGRRRRRGSGDRPALLAAVDTSGSMSAVQLEAIAGELSALGPLARITVVECDRRIQRVYAFEGRLREVTGRSGTDLRPVFRPEVLAEHRPDGIVYFTDGEGPYPEEDPGVRTLWVLTRPGTFGCPWGMRAHLDTEAPRARLWPLQLRNGSAASPGPGAD